MNIRLGRVFFICIMIIQLLNIAIGIMDGSTVLIVSACINAILFVATLRITIKLKKS